MADRLTVSLISPERTLYEGEADMVVAPAWDGEVGILRHHAPMLALLGEGEVEIRLGPEQYSFFVAGGFLQVAQDTVTILSERAEQD